MDRESRISNTLTTYSDQVIGSRGGEKGVRAKDVMIHFNYLRYPVHRARAPPATSNAIIYAVCLALFCTRPTVQVGILNTLTHHAPPSLRYRRQNPGSLASPWLLAFWSHQFSADLGVEIPAKSKWLVSRRPAATGYARVQVPTDYLRHGPRCLFRDRQCTRCVASRC